MKRIYLLPAALLALAACSHHEDAEEVTEEVTETVAPAPVPLRISRSVGNLALQFNDKNDAHLAFAECNGVKPIQSLRDIWQLKRPIVEVGTCDDFVVDSLTHSYAYLVPGAAKLLHEIGQRFNDSLVTRGGGDYRMKVTSLLRTAESVGRLKRGNINSVANSAHLYGTTFDISYAKFVRDTTSTGPLRTDGDLKNLLAEILLNLRAEGRCLVKYERKQGCFHITSTMP